MPDRLIKTYRPPFEVSKWTPFGSHALAAQINRDGWELFRVGSCRGQWRSTPEAFEILSIVNDKPGNGDFDHALAWFEESCHRFGRGLRVREIWNKRLLAHLVTKRGFQLEGEEDAIKRF